MSLEVLLSRICAKRSLNGPNHTLGGKEGREEKLPLSSPESQEPLSSDSLIDLLRKEALQAAQCKWPFSLLRSCLQRPSRPVWCMGMPQPIPSWGLNLSRCHSQSFWPGEATESVPREGQVWEMPEQPSVEGSRTQPLQEGSPTSLKYQP